MTLKEANKQLEQLENDYNYYLSEKERLLNKILPHPTDIRSERVDGGKRSDKILDFVETMDSKKIDETLEYIFQRKKNLINWIDEELRIMGKYGEIETLIVQLKENTLVKDRVTQKYRNMTWEEIGKRTNYNKDHCRKIYRLYKKKREIN